ncbi:fucose-1-phosphate guanylyltransferase-like [Liolophura sinensis]|uniref:fucose-1-phosphate guanylyltransferase-like n=1 Tax=Liolophura sinensis TaxID=3198878 RepID=UPI0031597A10
MSQNSSGSLSNMAGYTHKWLSMYDSIRGKQKKDFPFAFWDVVVITTADDVQKEAYELQLAEKLSRSELPEDVDYHIIADLPGPKLGNGGSTFTALARLNELYGEDLFEKRTLMLHAGGQSQRMPSASVLGKVFTALPFGSQMYQMIDLKLANSIPFLQNLKPGIFLLCADDFQIFDVHGEEKFLRMDQEGFTVLAHPGSLQLGTAHGVYVVQGGRLFTDKLVQTSECLEVLQKPSLERMEKQGAHLKRTKSDLSDDNSNGQSQSEPVVYTDSSFYFDSSVVKKMLQFYNEVKPLTCEIDAYGDFLQCLGSRSSVDYVTMTSNVGSVTADLIPMRKKVYHLLKDTPIHVLALNQSKYVHIGTTKELLFHLCEDTNLREELNLLPDVFNRWVNLGNKEKSEKVRRCEPDIKGCVMHSCLPSSSSIGSRAVVEFCHFEVPLKLGSNSVLSNCQLLQEESSLTLVDIPGNVFIHTASAKGDNSTGYVTVVFDIYENLKRKADGKESVSKLDYMKATLGKALEVLNIDDSIAVPEANDPCYNLWHTRLFPVTASMSASLSLALRTIQALQSDNGINLDLSPYKLMSMADVLKEKDVKDMLKYRRELYSLIKQG